MKKELSEVSKAASEMGKKSAKIRFENMTKEDRAEYMKKVRAGQSPKKSTNLIS